RGDHHHEEGGHLPVEVAVGAGEGDQGQVGGVEHQLDAHEDHDRVAAGQDTDAADREHDRGERDEGGGAHAWSPSCPVPPSWLAWVSSSMSVPAPIWRVTSSMSVAGSAEPIAPRAASVREIDASATEPSGSSAGVSIELCRAKTPGAGSGPGCRPCSA